ncbi:MAG: hypothetical protein JXB88_00100 [Spirochaetales bacterium]|nr:hypothetical protein [Spirochaetales bacterium]
MEKAFSFALKEFTIKKREDWIRYDEPYLWVFGIHLDSNTLGNNYVITIDNPGHKNLGKSKLTSGKTIPIPPDVGRIIMEVKPIGSFALTGIIIFAWEEDHTENKKVIEAYHESAKLINEFIRTSVNKMEINDNEKRDLKDKLKKKIKDIYKSAIKFYIPTSWDQDDFIGYESKIVFLDEMPENAELEFHFKGDNAHYVVKGEYGCLVGGVIFLINTKDLGYTGIYDTGWNNARLMTGTGNYFYILRGDEIIQMNAKTLKATGVTDIIGKETRLMTALGEYVYVIRGDELIQMNAKTLKATGVTDTGWTTARLMTALGEYVYVIRGDGLIQMNAKKLKATGVRNSSGKKMKLITALGNNILALFT